MTTTCTAQRRWRLGDVLSDTETSVPGHAALIIGSDRRRVGYDELSSAAGELTAVLRRRGLRRGDVIGVQMTTSAHFVVALLAAARLGIVVAPLNPALPTSEQRSKVDALGARVVLVDRDPDTAGACPEWQVVPGHRGLPTQLEGATSPRVVAPLAGLTADDALIMSTSGTSGDPKFVPWTHHNLAAAVTGIACAYGLSSADATVAVMPLFHGHGLVAGLLATLATGGTVLLPAAGRFSAHTFWDDVDAAGATWFTAVPTIHRILLDRAASGGPDEHRVIPPLRFIRSCSAPLSAETVTELEATFRTTVVAAYGMTETTHQASTVVPSADSDTRLHTVGAPTGLTARILRADGSVASVGEVGEICFRGPAVVRGYLPPRTDDVFDGEWLRTGDLGMLDDEQHLAVTGRIKNLINRGGEKISAEHVEEVLGAHPSIAQVAVVGLPDRVYGERVAAVIVRNTALTAQEVTDYARARLARYEVPDQFVFVDQLPLTAKGDVDRAVLRHQLEHGSELMTPQLERC